jgi:stage V sporulation protein AB
VAAGGILGTVWYLYSWQIPVGKLGLGIYGASSGIFVGAWAMALTEIIDTIPIFMRRIYLKKGLVLIVWSLAIGHTAGSLLHIFLWG